MAFVSAREYNVEGAPSTPLGLDPLAGKPILREDLNNAAYEQLVQQYVAAGMPEEKARRIAASQVKMYGPQGALGFANERANASADVREDVAALAKDDERHAQMKAGYDSATGMGATPALDAQFADMERYYGEQGRLRRAGLHSQTPVDPGTPEQQASWNQFLEDNTDEMRRYRPEEAAARDAEARNAQTKQLYPAIVAKYGEGEAKAWLAARESGDAYVPLTAHQQSMNATRQADQLAAARGDVGARDRLNEADTRYTQNVSAPRWIREAGLNPDDQAVKEMGPGALRLKANNARQADKKSRELQWRAQVMMNAGNFAGALALVGQDPVMQSAVLNQQNAALNANRGGGPINFGPNPLGVEAIHNQQLTDLGLRVAQGRGFQQPQMNPVQQQILQQQADAGRPVQSRAQDAVAAGRLNDPTVTQHADDLVDKHYSSRPGAIGVSTHFTDNEVMLAAQRLADDTGMPIGEAEKIMRRIQQDRNSYAPWAGSWADK